MSKRIVREESVRDEREDREDGRPGSGSISKSMTRGRTGQAREAGAGAAQRGIDYASFFPEENLLDT
ncbi:MAG: hypothetical protein ABGY24_08900, partial [bacterium]